MKIMGLGMPELIIVAIPLLIAVLFGVLSRNFGVKKGYGAVVCFIAGFFLGVIGLVVILVLPDKNASKQNAASDLINYKQLLDQGVITQDEFDRKKDELM